MMPRFASAVEREAYETARNLFLRRSVSVKSWKRSRNFIRLTCGHELVTDYSPHIKSNDSFVCRACFHAAHPEYR
jgi:hypothetical protein